MPLRPIGTIYTEEKEPAANSTDHRKSKVTYQVVSYKQAMGEGLIEIVEPIKIEYEDGQIIEAKR